jgi:rhodanese-related sulfurtransferase
VPSFRDRDEREPVSRKELLRRIRRKEVTLLDVRSAEQFEAGHLPGAVNIPIDELRRRLKEIPPSQQVVAYPSCIFSYEAGGQAAPPARRRALRAD